MKVAWVLLALACAACKRDPAPAGETQQVSAAPPTCKDGDGCLQQCNDGDREACFERGNTLIGHDDLTAAHAFERACSLGLAASCAHAGRMYEFAHGVAKDDAKAFSFYSQACDGGADVGCYNEAVLLEKGRGTDRDMTHAKALYARVCSAGSNTACADARRVSVLP